MSKEILKLINAFEIKWVDEKVLADFSSTDPDSKKVLPNTPYLTIKINHPQSQPYHKDDLITINLFAINTQGLYSSTKEVYMTCEQPGCNTYGKISGKSLANICITQISEELESERKLAAGHSFPLP